MNYQINISLICALFSVALFSACDDGSSAPGEPVDTFDAAVVCPADGLNTYGEPNRGTFTDARDGQVYKYTTIGKQVWMAENLKFDAPYSLCYDEIDGYCDTFGRFYSLHEDGEYQGLFDQELLDTICPKGWHVPSVEEWTQLAESMGGLEKAASRLYSSDSFGPRYLPGSNDCDFSSLPAGYWLMNGNLSFEYELSLYWTSVARSMIYSYSCVLDLDGFNFGKNHPKMTIRCLKD